MCYRITNTIHILHHTAKLHMSIRLNCQITNSQTHVRFNTCMTTCNLASLPLLTWPHLPTFPDGRWGRGLARPLWAAYRRWVAVEHELVLVILLQGDRWERREGDSDWNDNGCRGIKFTNRWCTWDWSFFYGFQGIGADGIEGIYVSVDIWILLFLVLTPASPLLLH